MGGVVSAIEDVVSSVGEAVGTVVNAAENVVNTVITDVVQPVANAVENTIQSAVNDPIGTIAKVAAVATGNVELLPLIGAADAAAHGASLENIVVSAGTSYVAGQIGTNVGDSIGSSLGNNLDICLSCKTQDVLNSGIRGATGSVLRGNNPLCGAVSGIVHCGINSGATSLYKCMTSGSNSNCTPLPTVSTTGLSGTTGCSTNTSVGALPGGCTSNTSNTTTQVGSKTDCCCCCDNTVKIPSVTVTGKKDTCCVCIPNGALPTSTATLPTVTVTGKKDTCCIDCCFTTKLPTVTVTGKKDTCCTDCCTTPKLPTVTVTGKKNTCCVDCCTTTTLPPVTVTGTKTGTTCIDCCCCCCCCTTIHIPGIHGKGPKNKPKPKPKVAGSSGGAGCCAIPWLNAGPEMLANASNFKKSSDINPADVKQIQSQLNPDLLDIMKQRSNFNGVPEVQIGGLSALQCAPSGSYASGGCVGGCSYCLNQNSKYMPKFVCTGADTLAGSAVSRRAPTTLAQLKQMRSQISQTGNMGGLAQGGLPSKYANAGPKGHNPEFVTGMTGYYACGGGTGQSDDIPAVLHDGDYVMDAEAVSALGDGSSKAGREVLDGFRKQVPHHAFTGGQVVPANIADGEYVFPAGFVTAIGGGSNKKGAEILNGLREQLRMHKRSAPTSKIPPKAKSPLDYIKKAKG